MKILEVLGHLPRTYQVYSQLAGISVIVFEIQSDFDIALLI